MSSRKIYIINPRMTHLSVNDPEFFTHYNLRHRTVAANLTLPTLAAFIPNDFIFQLIDEDIADIDFSIDVDFVFLTGRLDHYRRMTEIATNFMENKITVIIGGPLASLCPEMVRPYCDVLVEGEFENIAQDFFNDLRENRFKDHYKGTKTDLKNSPIPRWDLYPGHQTMMGAIQISRCCPFQCDFCDSIQYYGRSERHKPIDNIIKELDVLYKNGFRSTFIVDDNFTAYPKFSKEILNRIALWNKSKNNDKMYFFTQASINASGDSELLRLCSMAGINHVFVGIETPNAESIKEAKKYQNTGYDIIEQIKIFHEYGISVTAGMIVGFDADDENIFNLQLQTAMKTPIPIFNTRRLYAPPGTKFYKRLQEEKRIIPWLSNLGSVPWVSNIKPLKMSEETLDNGFRWLCRNVYDPSNFKQRIFNFIDTFKFNKEFNSAMNNPGKIQLEPDTLKIIKMVSRLGKEENSMVNEIFKYTEKNPSAGILVSSQLFSYMLWRYVYTKGNFW